MEGNGMHAPVAMLVRGTRGQPAGEKTSGQSLCRAESALSQRSDCCNNSASGDLVQGESVVKKVEIS